MHREISTLFRTVAVLIAVLAAPAVGAAQPLVVLDPGHGGGDPGAVGCGLEEEDVVLDVALRLRSALEAAGVRVTMTRDSDASVGLSARAELANAMGADVFVSNHSNANAGTPASGTETFVATAASGRSVELATGIQDAMVATWGLPDRGVKYADFVVVRDTSMPAALAELAFTNRCSPDAELLASETARQEMADAEAAAILAWLGVEPGMDGIVRGVVFEDQGVGTDDLSVRLPGATVTVIETSASATADSPDANWSFTVPAGSYTIEASAPGHATGRRTCVVTAASTTWCSIGLFPESAPVDAGAADAGGRDGGTVVPDAGDPMTRGDAGCGCRAGHRSGGGLSLMALVLVALIATRRARWLLAALLLGCGAPTVAPATAALGEPPAVLHAPFASIDVLRVIGDPSLELPVLSPDGERVLVTRRDRATLEVIDVASGERTVLATGPRVGVNALWRADGSVAVRDAHEDATAIPARALTVDGLPAPAMAASPLHAWIAPAGDEDVVMVRDALGIRAITPPDDHHLWPAISTDGRWALYWAVRTGVWVTPLSGGAAIHIGDPELAGGELGCPRFDPSGRFVALERTLDDGHAYTDGEVWLADLGTRPARVAVLTDDDTLARQPSLSRIDGEGRGRVAFTTDEGIVIAALAPAP